jgi:hypothetical protein
LAAAHATGTSLVALLSLFPRVGWKLKRTRDGEFCGDYFGDFDGFDLWCFACDVQV